MALTVRKLNGPMLIALVTAYNLWKREVTERETTFPHCDITSLTTGSEEAPTSSPYIMTSATASNLATVILRANDAKAVLNAHWADSVAHKAADTVIATPPASDQATSNTLLNAIKAKLNTHEASTAYHYTADGTNLISAADAADLATSITLANEIFTDGNAHIRFGFTSPSIQLVAP